MKLIRLAGTSTLIALTSMSLSGCDHKLDLSEPDTPSSGRMLLVQHPETSPGTDMVSRIAHAKKRVWMEMYSLNDPQVLDAVIAAKSRDVDVRVMLNHGYGVSESTKRSYTTLASKKIPVEWSPTGYIFHIKTTLIDDAAVISTANLNENNYISHRDFSIVDATPKHVEAIAATFNNDWALKGKPRNNTVKADGLVWSPDALDTFIDQIKSAKTSISMSSEEFKTTQLASALAHRGKGVSCQIMVPAQSDEGNISKEAVETVKKSGCSFITIKGSKNGTGHVYEHGKLLIIDDKLVIVGSHNNSSTSLKKNRELSVIVTDEDIVSALNTTLTRDMSN